MREPFKDHVLVHLQTFADLVSRIQTELSLQVTRLRPLCVEPMQTVVSMPSEELKGADWSCWSEAGSASVCASLAIHRSDDVALVTWSDMTRPTEHGLSVYDALEGDIVAVEHYKVSVFL